MQQQFEKWLQERETRSDQVTLAPLRRLAAMLDHDVPVWPENELPPLGHWLFHLPENRQSELDADGHPRRGGFMPPVPLPRRMWAGSRIRFLKRIPVGSQIDRHSTIRQISGKSTQSGEMTLITVHHEIRCGGETAIEEQQDIAYIGGPSVTRPRAHSHAPLSQSTRRVKATPELLFRFSALTFNAHRIHYDRDYARDVEHYPGLVVHGPLIATLVMDHFLRHAPGTRVTAFRFRAHAPTFEGEAFDLHLAAQPGGAELWVTGEAGDLRMTARIETA